MTEPLAYLNGRFVPYALALLPLHDAGFVFGATVTDRCRTFRRRLYRLDDHISRFQESCRLARVPQPLADKELEQIAEHLVAVNSAGLAAERELDLVLIATPGELSHYAGLPSGSASVPTLAVHTFPLPFARYRHLFEVGAHLVVPATRPIPANCVDPRIKHRSRLHWWLAEQEAKETASHAAAILLDADGNISETAAANVLVVKDGVLYRAPYSRVLEGISQKVIAELSSGLGIPIQERLFTVEECLRADEMLLSSSSFCLAGVSRLNHTAMPWAGPIYERLLAGYSDRVGVDIRGQFLSNP
jgi:branched-subunit amino acid aminotransferase/4-amino-4-deoxychorismate lyase